MTESIHEAAPDHLPRFIAAPGETDTVLIFVAVLLLGIVLLIGNIYFRLHALPEKMAHRANSAQLQLVGILALLAMFTHNNLFWVAALLIAALKLPDFSTPLNAIATAVEKLNRHFDQQGPSSDEASAAAAPPGSAGGSEHGPPPDPGRGG